jgi:hypothetical protein
MAFSPVCFSHLRTAASTYKGSISTALQTLPTVSAARIVEPTPEKLFENNVAARGTVQNGIGNHRYRLHRRVQSQEIAFRSGFRQGIDAGIAPHIGAVALELSQLNVVSMLLFSLSEDKDQLMLRPIE